MLMSEHPLRSYRLAKGVTLESLAAKAGCSGASLSRIEKGSQAPSIELAKTLEQLTGVRRWELRPDVWEKPQELPDPSAIETSVP